MLQQQKHTVKIAAGMLPTAKTYCELLLVLCAAYKGRDFALVTPYCGPKAAFFCLSAYARLVILYVDPKLFLLV